MNAASIARLGMLYPDVKVRALRLIQDVREQMGMSCEIAQGLRSYADQLALWSKGRILIDGHWAYADPVHQEGVVTRARPGDSWHHFSAFDICFSGGDPFLEETRLRSPTEWEGTWARVARIGYACGLEPGYLWQHKDRPHFQICYGYTLEQVKGLYASGGLEAVWAAYDQARGVPIGQARRRG